ncbi:YfiR family protein [Saccharophagus degradans]|uniref:YfiR family protein n=1 Tax=Saccharophagus degradans TaxID=86304 RepID=UPI002477DD4C|nr:YfiR family protein [Saccharophagus degradans]WGO96960.1 YfiR family protein [Saccharophagus degradans]
MIKIKPELLQFGTDRLRALKSGWGKGVFCLLILVFYSIASSAQGVQRKLDESVVRAYVVVAILKYTQWGQNTQPLDQLTLCSVGEPLSQNYLSNAVRSFAHPNVKAFNYYNLDDKNSYRLEDGTEVKAKHCDVLVVGPEFNTRKALGADKSALYICDGLKQGEQDCAVELGLTRGKVSFVVDLNHAQSAGAVFSSSLLELAESIEGRR